VNNTKHIKYFFVYLLVFVYSFALIKPILPIVSDFMAHTFYKLEHTASVHYENGKYHLHAELKTEAIADKNLSKQNSSTIKYETLQHHIFTKNLKFFSFGSILKNNFFSSNQSTLVAHLELPTPPPKI
jgi:hypothetical protein